MARSLILVTLLLYSMSCFSQDNRGYVVKIGDKAPDFTVQLSNGETFKLSDNRGKVVMLQFTASWCGVCRKEMPFIESEIYQQLKGKNFVLIALDKNEPLEKVNELIEQTVITYPVGLDKEGEVFNKYAQKRAGITRNVIINADGEIVFLTRLFERHEFNKMKQVLFELVRNN